jgi:prephenate dehydrogenase
MYFEIQKLNDHGLESLRALQHAVERVLASVTGNNPHEFAALMEQGREYFADRTQAG